MERLFFNIRQICVVVTLLVLGTVGSIIGFAGGTSWHLLFSPMSGDGIRYIPRVKVVAEWPLTETTRKALLSNAPIESKTFDVSVDPTTSTRPATFREQFEQGMRANGLELKGDLRNREYAFYFDLSDVDLTGLSYPYLYYYGVWSPHNVYVDKSLIHRAGPRERQIVAGQIDSKIAKRIIFFVKNDRSDEVPGLHIKHGISLRSGPAMSMTGDIYSLQANFPRIVNSTVFCLLGLLAFSLAVSSAGYLDVWAFACFSFAMGLQTWTFNPIFYLGFADHGEWYSIFQISTAALVVSSSSLLTLAFFRLEGQRNTFEKIVSFLTGMRWKERLRSIKRLGENPFSAVAMGTFLLCVIVVARSWTVADGTAPWKVISAANELLSYVLIASQSFAVFFGVRHLTKVRRELQGKALQAQLQLMRMRCILSALFCVCMAIMLLGFAVGLGSLSLEIGSEVVLLSALFPALAMLLMFQWMTTSAQRFHKRFAPRLGQIDHEVMAFGAAALEKRYQGTLLVFDLAGMKRLNELRDLSSAVETVIDGLISRVETELGRLIQTDQTTFRYKSNGDEFIFAMRARDLDAAKAQLVELVSRWKRVSSIAMQAWRAYLIEELRQVRQENLSDDAILAVANALDLHVLVTTMHAMKITVKGGVDRPTAAPDFVEARFTALSALFKPTTHTKVAIYADDAALVLASQTEDGTLRFEEEKPASGDKPAMGFLMWDSTHNRIAA